MLAVTIVIFYSTQILGIHKDRSTQVTKKNNKDDKDDEAVDLNALREDTDEVERISKGEKSNTGNPELDEMLDTLHDEGS